MDDAQLAVYSADIAANTDPAVVNALAAGDHESITNWYNQISAPSVWVFVPSISRNMIVGAMDWTTEYNPGFIDDMAAIQFIVGSEYDPRPVEARNALNAVFTGAPNSKQGILNLAVIETTYARALFISATTGPGGGDGSVNSAAALDILGADATVDDTRLAVGLIA